MHVAHTLDCVANVFERTRCAIHFQVFENVVECDGYALVEFCRLLERFKIESRVGDMYAHSVAGNFGNVLVCRCNLVSAVTRTNEIGEVFAVA